jgi:hypothetical protein
MIAGERFHPCSVIVGALTQQFLARDRNAEHLPEEVVQLFGPRQITQLPVDDDTVEAVAYKKQQAAKQLCERVHRSSSPVLVLTARSSDRLPVVSKFQIFWLEIIVVLDNRCAGNDNRVAF